jgi:hypothetical protein
MPSHFASQQQQGGFLDRELDPSQGHYKYKEEESDELTNAGTFDNANRHHDTSAYEDTVMADEETSTFVNHPNDTTNGHSQDHTTVSQIRTIEARQDCGVTALKKKKKNKRYEGLLQESSQWISELEDVKWKLQKASMRNTVLLDFMAMQALDESPQEAAAMAVMTQSAPRMN